MIFFVVAILAASPHLGAKVYRCEADSGVVYSDLPCGESAEEIVLDVPQPASDPGASQTGPEITPASRPVETKKPGPAISEGERNISQFLKMLHDQRQQQLGEMDRTIALLRAQTQGEAFQQLEQARQAEILAELDRLESSRESVLAEYSALIQEARSRLE